MLLLTGLLEKWKLSRKETAILMGYDDERSLNNLLSGISNLQTRDEKDRIRHLFDIHETLFNIFKNTDDVAEWLREPSKGLDRKKPLEILLEGSMENLLLIKQFVDHLAGR